MSRVTAFAAPSGLLLLLLLCAAVLRIYRRRLGDRDRVELDRTRRDATTDALTGLGNRRALMADLEAVLAYTRRNGGRPSVGRQMRDVLLATLTEREPDLTAHVHDVAALAIAVGQRLELTPVELDEVARAAELHDIDLRPWGQGRPWTAAG